MNRQHLHSRLAEILSTSSATCCVLLVHPEVGTLAHIASELVTEYGWPRLSLGQELSANLMAVPLPERPYAAQRWLESRARESSPGPVLCTEIDLLFEPSFHLDPFKVFLGISRTTRLVVAWPGHYDNDTLSYALPEHRHYRIWRSPECQVIAL